MAQTTVRDLGEAIAQAVAVLEAVSDRVVIPERKAALIRARDDLIRTAAKSRDDQYRAMLAIFLVVYQYVGDPGVPQANAKDFLDLVAGFYRACGGRTDCPNCGEEVTS